MIIRNYFVITIIDALLADLNVDPKFKAVLRGDGNNNSCEHRWIASGTARHDGRITFRCRNCGRYDYED